MSRTSRVSAEAPRSTVHDATVPAEVAEEQTVLQVLEGEQTFLPCPGDDTVALWLDDALEASGRQAIEHHVDRCHNCRRLLAGLAQDDARGLTLSSSPDDFTRRLEPGESLGNFVVSHLIGAGGMGAVYLARDAMLERDVALKVLATPVSGSPEAAARLLDEARATARLNHPNIVTIHAVGEDRNTPYLALEYVPGQRLRDWLDRSNDEPPAGLAYFADVATALDVAHRAGVVHRDLKPENVLLRDDGVVKVVDFGLAGGLRSSADAQTVRLAAGTPRYMAPEQWRGEPQDAAVDVWALGVMLFEWVAGEHPFGARRGRSLDQAGLRARVLAGNRAPLTARSVTPTLRATIEACLAPDAGDRPPIEEVRQALVAPASTPSRRGLVAAIAMAILVAAVSVGLASTDTKTRPPAPAPTPAPAAEPSVPPSRTDGPHVKGPSEPSTPPRAAPGPPASAAVPPGSAPPATAPAPTAPAPAGSDLYREW